MVNKLIIKTLLFFMVVIFMLVCVHFVPVDSNQFLAAIIDKHNALSSTPGARLIAIGGSNVAYGFDSERLAMLIHRPVINMGLHANLGLKFMLTDLYPYIHSGDIVLIMPEYIQFFNNHYEGLSYKLAELLDTYPEGIWSLDAYQIINMQKEYAPLLRSKISRALASIQINPFYYRYLFNKYGDIKKEIKSTPSQTIRDTPYVNENDKFDINSIKFLNNFNKKIAAKGARILLIYPAGRKTNCEASGSRLNLLDKELKGSLDFPILLSPSETCINDSYFSDTEYHLNNEGTELRMDVIADLLISNGFITG
jgi:hypothetical protein